MASRLKEVRNAKGMAVYGLAAAAGSSPATVVFIERYGHNPRLDTKQRLARALGVDVADIWPNEKEGSVEA